MYKRVLVTLDESELSESVLPEVERMASGSQVLAGLQAGRAERTDRLIILCDSGDSHKDGGSARRM